MKKARLADGRIREYPDGMDDGLIQEDIKKFLASEEQDKQQEQVRNQQEFELNNQRINNEKAKLEMDQQDRQFTREAGEKRHAETMQVQTARMQSFEQGMVGLSQGLSAIAEMMGQLIESMNRMQELKEAVMIVGSELSMQLVDLNKTIVKSSKSINDTLKLPKEVVTSESGKVKGIQIKDSEESIH